MDHHLDGEEAEDGANGRNGDFGDQLRIEGQQPIPGHRDRQLFVSVTSVLRPDRRRLPDFDDKIVLMYARGMTVPEIQGYGE